MVATAGAVVLGRVREPFEVWEAQFASPVPRLLSVRPEPLSVESTAIALEKVVGPDGRQLFPEAFRDTRLDRDYEPSWTELDAGSALAYELSGQVPSQLGTAGVVAVAQGCAKMIAHYEARLAEAFAELSRGVLSVLEPERVSRLYEGCGVRGVAGARVGTVARGRQGCRGRRPGGGPPCDGERVACWPD